MRLFDEHTMRECKSLDGTWKFRVDEKDEGISCEWEKGLPDGAGTVVPSVWNSDKGLLNYEGAAWYEKSFYSSGGTLRFVFGAVMTAARIWLDGELLGEHYGGFCEFSFVRRGVKSGVHTLTVRADNRFDEDSIPQKYVDWWHYGGIIRSVTVERLEGICVLYAKTEYKLSDDLHTAFIKQRAELYNAAESAITDSVRLSAFGAVKERQVRLAAGESVGIEMSFDTEVRLWDPDDPYLYTVTLSTTTDDLTDRIGFRKTEVRPDGIYINGRRREIRGVNRHEEHPEWGFAFPAGLMRRDLDIIADMGCNAIRGSHYPNSRMFVDLCDERGLLFWSEIPIWGCGFEPETLGREKVLNRGLQMHREAVRHYYNHPSVIIWGMHNEIYSDSEQGYAMSELYYGFLKENGGDRIVTYASRLPMTDICFKFCDVICLNIYKGWYEGEPESWEGFLEEFRRHRHELGFDGKPVIMAEFGAAAVYGYSTFDNVRWTEEYQARLLSHCLELFRSDPMICGAYIWQFADIRSQNQLNRARGFNNKGVVNEYRKPKLAYYAVKEKYTRFALQDAEERE